MQAHAIPTWRPRFRFHGGYAFGALVIFLVEVAIATVGAHIPWLRGYAGDVIVVGFVHCLLAMALRAPTFTLAVASFGIACGVEFSQYLSKVNGWVIANPVLRTIVGSTPEWEDVGCYALGLLLILLTDAAIRAAREPSLLTTWPARYPRSGSPGSPAPRAR